MLSKEIVYEFKFRLNVKGIVTLRKVYVCSWGVESELRLVALPLWHDVRLCFLSFVKNFLLKTKT